MGNHFHFLEDSYNLEIKDKVEFWLCIQRSIVVCRQFGNEIVIGCQESTRKRESGGG